MNAARPPIWVVLKAHLASDPRKTGVLAFLFVVMVVIYVRWMLTDAAPQDAAAAITAVVPGPAAAPAPPPAPVRFKPERPLVKVLTRDPFAVRPERFAVDPNAPVAPAKTAAATPETRPAGPDQAFQLQSTICGPMPMAWINGRCVQPGEEIDGFRLESVEPTRVVLRRDGLERVLSMD